jgi:hypothetical protein
MNISLISTPILAFTGTGFPIFILWVGAFCAIGCFLKALDNLMRKGYFNHPQISYHKVIQSPQLVYHLAKKPEPFQKTATYMVIEKETGLPSCVGSQPDADIALHQASYQTGIPVKELEVQSIPYDGQELYYYKPADISKRKKHKD